MAREPHDLFEDVTAADLRARMESLLERVDEIDLLKEIYRGLADVEAGRITPHEEAMAGLLSRYQR